MSLQPCCPSPTCAAWGHSTGLGSGSGVRMPAGLWLELARVPAPGQVTPQPVRASAVCPGAACAAREAAGHVAMFALWLFHTVTPIRQSVWWRPGFGLAPGSPGPLPAASAHGWAHTPAQGAHAPSSIVATGLCTMCHCLDVASQLGHAQEVREEHKTAICALALAGCSPEL